MPCTNNSVKYVKLKDFKVVVSVPKGCPGISVPEGCKDIRVPYGINSIQLSGKSRKNRERSAASLYQFVLTLAHKVLTIHSNTPREIFGSTEGARKLRDEIVRRIAGDFFPKIREHENSLTEEERTRLWKLTQYYYMHNVRDIEESELESYLAIPPNPKEQGVMNYSELQILDESEGVSNTVVPDAEAFDGDNEKEPKNAKKPKKVTETADSESVGLEGEEMPRKRKKLRKKKKPVCPVLGDAVLGDAILGDVAEGGGVPEGVEMFVKTAPLVRAIEEREVFEVVQTPEEKMTEVRLSREELDKEWEALEGCLRHEWDFEEIVRPHGFCEMFTSVGPALFTLMCAGGLYGVLLVMEGTFKPLLDDIT
ncbi:putative transmembrane protein [Gregarina niphandrodes]|uniref:Transmembrane protein n=1 Tax=Gregarina niphandrodes TaxID=110365 RepID=A0A023AZP6_GRENI|nr:putative transmembrane protein [Gregarina niphandrodes]EZG43785.1 putative transmembrane protein [Gregarina niphandrodes]|eukprot:XP_011134604.1 putative transmembrane protein [Gregarina niphandrodes]